MIVEEIAWNCHRRSSVQMNVLSVSVASIEGSYLEITDVTRLHMGPYLCIASNGVPPTVSKRIVLIVHCTYETTRPSLLFIQHSLLFLISRCSLSLSVSKAI